jgi:hypothetical protein
MSREHSISAVEAILGYTFDKPETLRRALSAAGAPSVEAGGNKKMAMLGATILKLVLLIDLVSTDASRG